MCSFFKVAVGDFDLIKKYVPAVLSNGLLTSSDIRSASSLAQPKYSSYYELDSEFIVIEFEKTLTYLLISAVLTLPTAFVLSKVFPRVSRF